MEETLREITPQEFEQMKNNFGYDEGKEDEYQRIKGMFNSIYGMSVTNNIRDDVIYNEDKEQEEQE